MAKKPKKSSKPTLKAAERGTFEGLFDALFAAPIRGLGRMAGMSERDSYQYSQRAVQAANDITGLVSAEDAINRIRNGIGTARDYVTAALPVAPAIVGKGIGRVVRSVNRAAPPAVRNRLYNERLMGPEYVATDNLPAYGFRNVSGPDEVSDIIQSGYMRPTKEGGGKYFTMSDKELGNPANLGSKPVLRVDSKNIPINSPVRAEHVMIWDSASQRFVPIIRKRRD